MTRELLLELPPHEFEREQGVAQLLLRVVNSGLRPHLTQWQAEYRSWWEEAVKADGNRGKTPQEVQQQYPRYAALVSDLKQTNTELSKLADELLIIARTRKQKPSRKTTTLPLQPTPAHPLVGQLRETSGESLPPVPIQGAGPNKTPTNGPVGPL